jgi:hypothetical protein
MRAANMARVGQEAPWDTLMRIRGDFYKRTEADGTF